MIAIPIQFGPGPTYNVILVLEDSNLERIKAYDPAVFESGKIDREPFKNLKLADVCVAYASAEEIKRIQTLYAAQDIRGVMEILFKGWDHKPEDGDHDTKTYQNQTFN